ncbi:uncharacterized protein [Spinacia oleracea]|uniref:Uncharacterized protein LOC110790312 isoform X1 n=1 Tax=Spinacia oleracea TaxID=3562 RepID=A0A9R0IK10_SPIOL|nr:uncharacterized protein LOC110790312 isoform X1 [Spinacia oleracea]XP_021850785.1 uncharacterized protein LOC110790312 isoform X2 [Spinacia oleracea]
MARTNKYTSLNFNDIYDKKILTATATATSRSSSSSAAHPHKSYSLSASSRLGHGGMLVLSRPSPKPQPPPQQPPPQSQPQQPPSNSVAPSATPSPRSSKSPDSDSISLRPQGKTGGSPTFQERENGNNKVDVPSPKSNKFVPPHLRPGFVAREAASVPEFQKPRQGNFRPGSAHGNYHGSPNRYIEDGRPKSGSGYERRMRAAGPVHGAAHAHAPAPVGVESDSIVSNRPRSGGSRPCSSG